MSNAWDKIIGVFLIIALMIFTPLMLLELHSDQVAQSYVNDAVEEFINKSCASSVISSTSYEEMVNRLDATGITYDIYLVHEKEQVEPEVDNNNNLVTNSYVQYYEEYRGEEIYDTLFPDDGTEGIQRYYLNNGDYIRVVVENTSSTTGSRMFSSIMSSHSGKTVFCSYGGYVGNEIDVR